MNSAYISRIFPQFTAIVRIERANEVRSGIEHHVICHNRRCSAIRFLPARGLPRNMAAGVSHLQTCDAIAVSDEGPRTLIRWIDPDGDGG